MQGLSDADDVFEKNWYPCLRRASHGADGIDSQRFKGLFQGVLYCPDQRKPAIPDFPLAFQDLFEMIERVEGIRKFPGLGGKYVRVELHCDLFDN